MSAFNWIVFFDECPQCNNITLIKAQCHVASSFHGNESGRFCDRTYKLMEEMLWWPKSDIKWSKWSEVDGTLRMTNDDVQECCYAGCTSCGANLYAVIQFQLLKPVSIIEIGLEDQWPSKFTK